MNIGVDVGNSATKVFNGTMTERVVFPSLVLEGYDHRNEGDRIKVKYDNRDFSVGIGQSNVTKVKYFSENYKIMLLTAIAKATKEINIDVNVCVSIPASQYKDEALISKIKSTVLNYGTQTIEVEGIVKNICIKKVGVWVESGIILIDPARFKNDKVIIVDIGGGTIDSIEFNYGKRGKSDTVNNGIIRLKERVYDNFRADHPTNLGHDDIIELFQKVKESKEFYVNGENIPLTKYRNMLENYIYEVFNYLELHYTLGGKKILFMGGGSLELEDFFKVFEGSSSESSYDFAILPNANYLNSIANYNFAVNHLDKE